MNWYLEDIERLERKEKKRSAKKKVIFYGSSSFTRWEELEKVFTRINAVNMGFGGSTLAACAWFFKRVIVPLKPDGIIIYAGDNDLGDGRTPEEVVLSYYQIIYQIRETLGKIPVWFVSIKPSPARRNLIQQIEYANDCIREHIQSSCDNLFYIDVYSSMINEKGEVKEDLYHADGLHLSTKGYELWYEIISGHCYQFFKNQH